MADEQQAPDGISRRRFLSVVGVSSAGAVALSGCSTDKVEKLIPYLVQSEDQVPGIPTIYASTCTECSAGCGLHVVTREARAVKLEGNPEHPVNKGKLCARGQAALQGLYNPGRTRNPRAKQGAAFAVPSSPFSDWTNSADTGSRTGRDVLKHSQNGRCYAIHMSSSILHISACPLCGITSS